MIARDPPARSPLGEPSIDPTDPAAMTPEARALGLRADGAWLPAADEVWAFGDVSEGMASEIASAHRMGIPVRRQP